MHEINNNSDYRQSLKDKILEKAMADFSKRGVKAVKMDDIANSLSISKRTLYEVYANKEELVFEGVKYFKKLRYEQDMTIIASCDNVMDILLQMFIIKIGEMKLVSPVFFSDISKYPKITSFFQKEHEKDRLSIINFMKRGVSEGYFRPDVNYELLASMFDIMSKSTMEHKLYQQFSMDEIFKNVYFVFTRGICTNKGLDVLDDFCKKKFN